MFVCDVYKYTSYVLTELYIMGPWQVSRLVVVSTKWHNMTFMIYWGASVGWCVWYSVGSSIIERGVMDTDNVPTCGGYNYYKLIYFCQYHICHSGPATYCEREWRRSRRVHAVSHWSLALRSSRDGAAGTTRVDAGRRRCRHRHKETAHGACT